MNSQEGIVHYMRYYLGDDNFYFVYRPDRHDTNIVRAELFQKGKDEPLCNLRVSAGYGQPEKTHFDVINAFEIQVINIGKPTP